MIGLLALFAAATGQLGPPEALQASLDANFDWKVCVMRLAGRYADLKESNATIVDAALAGCQQNEDAFASKMAFLTIDDRAAFTPDFIPKIVADERVKRQRDALAALIEVRFLRNMKK